MDLVTFWKRVDKRPDGCWLWTGATNSSGYGTVCFGGKTVCAHRLAAYDAGIVESIMAPMNRKGTGFILHQCDTPACCNPEHMRIGTYSENQKEAYARKLKTQPTGSQHANAKLSDSQVKRIRSAYAKGATQMFLSKQYAVSQRVISLVVRKESYR